MSTTHAQQAAPHAAEAPSEPARAPRVHAIALADLERGGVVRARTPGGFEILAVNTEDGVRVYRGVCPHLGGPLLEGEVADGAVRCPWHGYAFDLRTARCRTAPGGPWRALVDGPREDDTPMAIRLAPLAFEHAGDQLLVALPEGVR